MENAMKLSIVELLNIANEAYDSGNLGAYFDSSGGDAKPEAEDRLARFIVAELRDTFNPDAIRSVQLSEARLALTNAIENLERVIEKLE